MQIVEGYDDLFLFLLWAVESRIVRRNVLRITGYPTGDSSKTFVFKIQELCLVYLRLHRSRSQLTIRGVVLNEVCAGRTHHAQEVTYGHGDVVWQRLRCQRVSWSEHAANYEGIHGGRDARWSVFGTQEGNFNLMKRWVGRSP